MSAVLSLIQSRAGHLFTDGVALGPDGRVAALGPKMAVLAASKSAVVARGMIVCGVWPRELFALKSLEAVVESLPILAQWLQDTARSRPGLPGYSAEQASVEVVVVGWSELRGEAQSWVVSTGAADDDGPAQSLPGFRPGLPLRTPRLWGGPSADLASAIGRDLRTEAELDELEPRGTGLRIMEAMRAVPRLLPSGHTCSTVGGHAAMATATSAGVSSDLLHVWSDHLGARIAV